MPRSASQCRLRRTTPLAHAARRKTRPAREVDAKQKSVAQRKPASATPSKSKPATKTTKPAPKAKHKPKSPRKPGRKFLRSHAAARARRRGPAREAPLRPALPGQPAWSTFDDHELDQLRICDLLVRIEGTALEDRIGQLYDELDERGLHFFRPHFWLSNEWFSPDGIPGIAIPFYLAHPRLMRLERRQMLEVEGGSRDWCLRILRHEAGHAIDSAYQLHRRRKWRENFGRNSQPYPEFYQPKPYSKSFVLHLDLWYAQSHPAEDFAETFAVWLKPRSRWRTQYRDWPALKKLEYVDELMQDICQQKPPVTSRQQVDPVKDLKQTLGEHYRAKRQRYGGVHPGFYDRELRRLFSSEPRDAGRETAAQFLGRIRPELRRTVSYWTGGYQYMIDRVLEDMIARCRQLRLRLDRPERQARRDTLVMLTVQTMNYLHGGHHRLAL